MEWKWTSSPSPRIAVEGHPEDAPPYDLCARQLAALLSPRATGISAYRRAGHDETMTCMTEGVSEAGRTAEAVRARLERAADGLLFLSEVDAPFEYVELPGIPDGEIAADAVAEALGEPDAPMEARSLDDFLAGHVEHVDPADTVAQQNVARFEALKAALMERLSGVCVFRVGAVEVRYYVIGRTAEGRVAGLVTRALET